MTQQLTAQKLRLEYMEDLLSYAIKKNKENQIKALTNGIKKVTHKK